MKSNTAASRKVAKLYERFGPAIYSRCRRLLRDPVAAEDASQEVFLRVLRHLDSAPHDDAMLAWVYRISTNYCLNLMRDQQRHAEPMEELPEVGGKDLEGELLTRDFTERLMSSAPAKLTTAVMLYHVKGMEQADIARAMGISRRTVIYRLAEFADHARQKLYEAEA